MVVRDGEVLLNEGFGVRDIEAELPVSTQTLFPIGSSTKTFTAAALVALAREHSIDLDAPIRTYRPGFAMRDPEATELLSLRDCLSHRSGLPRHDLVWQARDGEITRRDIIDALAHLPPSQPFRTAYQYNNLLYMAAGELAAGLANCRYEDAVTSRILEPLNMSRSNFSVATTQEDPDHATPYTVGAEGEPARAIPFATLDLAGPAGGLNSCTDDLVPWLITLTGRWAGRVPRPLSSVVAELGVPSIPMPDEGGGPVTPVGYGMGLMLADYRGRRVSHHGGNIDGFSCEILTREDGIGIAVLCNLNVTWLRDSVPYLILDALDGVVSPDHGAFFRDHLAARLASAQAARTQSTSEAHSAPARPFIEYAGWYRHPAYGDCAVTDQGEGLRWDFGSIPSGSLAHRHGDDFEILTTLNGVETRFAAHFTSGPAGSVDALRIRLEPAVPPIPFLRHLP